MQTKEKLYYSPEKYLELESAAEHKSEYRESNHSNGWRNTESQSNSR
jgi:hypothetical protein